MTLEEENGAFYFSQTLTEINLTRNEKKKSQLNSVSRGLAKGRDVAQ